MKKWICFCLKTEKRIWSSLLLAVLTGVLCYGITMALWTHTGEAITMRIRFAQVTPVAGKDIKNLALSESADSEKSSTIQKMSYERMKGGDVMYSAYFGLLNVRSAPEKDAELVGQIAYGDEVRVFWKEDSGYVRVIYQKPYSDEYVEGYCVREELSETAPSDGRVYLAVFDFKQYDEHWGGISLGSSYETIASAGCTTTCLAMAYSYLEGVVSTPDIMEERLYYNSDGLLSFPKVYTKSSDGDYLSAAYEKLKEKIPVLIGGKKDDGSPHWVLIMGYAGAGTELKTEDFLIHDPASEERYTLADFFAEYPNFNKIAYYSGA